MDVSPRRWILSLLVIAIAVLVVAPTAGAAPRKVPAGFFGVSYDREIIGAPDPVQDRQWNLMTTSGVESVRALANWNILQPKRNGRVKYELLDSTVARAAWGRQRLMFTVVYTPRWARQYPHRPLSPPKSSAQYAGFVKKLVQRYGPDGDFWPEHPNVPYRPVGEWQIWNEPHLRLYWDVKPGKRGAWPGGYRRIVKAAYKAIKRTDPSATVALAGLTGRAWDNLSAILRDRSMNRYFNVASLQTYPQTPHRAVRATQLMRIALRRAHSRNKRIWLTELSWPASKGHTKPIKYQKPVTSSGMAKRVSAAYKLLGSARIRRRFGLGRVYWYTWASPYGKSGSIFNYSGLVRYNGGSVFKKAKALRAYRNTAVRLEGCAKTKFGVCR
jgi:hypothetical protein